MTRQEYVPIKEKILIDSNSNINPNSSMKSNGSNIGDDHKEYFSGDMALLASGEDNTMNQF